MNTKPYAVVNVKTGAVVRTFVGLPAAYRYADRLGDGFKFAFVRDVVAA